MRLNKIKSSPLRLVEATTSLSLKAQDEVLHSSFNKEDYEDPKQQEGAFIRGKHQQQAPWSSALRTSTRGATPGSSSARKRVRFELGKTRDYPAPFVLVVGQSSHRRQKTEYHQWNDAVVEDHAIWYSPKDLESFRTTHDQFAVWIQQEQARDVSPQSYGRVLRGIYMSCSRQELSPSTQATLNRNLQQLQEHLLPSNEYYVGLHDVAMDASIAKSRAFRKLQLVKHVLASQEQERLQVPHRRASATAAVASSSSHHQDAAAVAHQRSCASLGYNHQEDLPSISAVSEQASRPACTWAHVLAQAQWQVNVWDDDDDEFRVERVDI